MRIYSGVRRVGMLVSTADCRRQRVAIRARRSCWGLLETICRALPVALSLRVVPGGTGDEASCDEGRCSSLRGASSTVGVRQAYEDRSGNRRACTLREVPAPRQYRPPPPERATGRGKANARNGRFLWKIARRRHDVPASLYRYRTARGNKRVHSFGSSQVLNSWNYECSTAVVKRTMVCVPELLKSLLCEINAVESVRSWLYPAIAL